MRSDAASTAHIPSRASAGSAVTGLPSDAVRQLRSPSPRTSDMRPAAVGFDIAYEDLRVEPGTVRVYVHADQCRTAECEREALSARFHQCVTEVIVSAADLLVPEAPVPSLRAFRDLVRVVCDASRCMDTYTAVCRRDDARIPESLGAEKALLRSVLEATLEPDSFPLNGFSYTQLCQLHRALASLGIDDGVVAVGVELASLARKFSENMAMVGAHSMSQLTDDQLQQLAAVSARAGISGVISRSADLELGKRLIPVLHSDYFGQFVSSIEDAVAARDAGGSMELRGAITEGAEWLADYRRLCGEHELPLHESLMDHVATLRPLVEGLLESPLDTMELVELRPAALELGFLEAVAGIDARLQAGSAEVVGFGNRRITAPLPASGNSIAVARPASALTRFIDAVEAVAIRASSPADCLRSLSTAADSFQACITDTRVPLDRSAMGRKAELEVKVQGLMRSTLAPERLSAEELDQLADCCGKLAFAGLYEVIDAERKRLHEVVAGFLRTTATVGLPSLDHQSLDRMANDLYRWNDPEPFMALNEEIRLRGDISRLSDTLVGNLETLLRDLRAYPVHQPGAAPLMDPGFLLLQTTALARDYKPYEEFKAARAPIVQPRSEEIDRMRTALQGELAARSRSVLGGMNYAQLNQFAWHCRWLQFGELIPLIVVEDERLHEAFQRGAALIDDVGLEHIADAALTQLEVTFRRRGDSVMLHLIQAEIEERRLP